MAIVQLKSYDAVVVDGVELLESQTGCIFAVLIRNLSLLPSCLPRQYEKRFEKDDKEKDRRKAREAMSDKIRLKLEFRQQVRRLSTVAP